MSVERKCKTCNTWNKDNDNCTNCGALISPSRLREIFIKKRNKRNENLPPDKFDVFLNKWKNSNNLLLKGLYYIFYSILSVFFGIAFLIAYLVALISA